MKDRKMHQMKCLKKANTGGIFLLISCMFATLILSGCVTVGPDYVLPETKIPGEWHNELKGGVTGEVQDPQRLAKWWTTLNDPVLSGLIERAVVNNPDIKKARAKIREQRARRNISNAGLFPTIDASGSFTRKKGSEETGGEKRRIFTQRVSMRAGNWICSEEPAVLLRLQPQTFRQAKKICGMFWSPFLPRLP